MIDSSSIMLLGPLQSCLLEGKKMMFLGARGSYGYFCLVKGGPSLSPPL